MTAETCAIVPTRVRFAERCDFDQVMFLCRELHAENGLFEMSEPRVRSVINSHFDRTGGMIGVIGGPECLESAIVLRIGGTWYSDQLVLEELFAFTLPEFRRSDNAKHLIDFATSCAVETGLPLLISVIANDRTAAKVGMYRRKLGTPAGEFFVANSQCLRSASI